VASGRLASRRAAKFVFRSRRFTLAGFLWLLSNSFNVVAIPGCQGSNLSHHRECSMTKLFARFLQDQTGATAIEYGLIASGIALAIIAVVNGLGTTLNTKFTSINTSLK
jgi:pilus assembly protein Flp/PilA